MERKLEICANSIASALAAQKGGADRIELCDNLNEGGTTPSYGSILQVKKNLRIPVFVLIRPRGGDFCYSDEEFSAMRSDIEICNQLGCEGVVFGILEDSGNIDLSRCRELLTLARPMQVTFHRAFDQCANQQIALEELIGLGFDRVLTSGGCEKAMDALPNLKNLVAQAANRITVMPGSGLTADNIRQIAEQTNAAEFHGSAKKVRASGPAGNENSSQPVFESDAGLVREMKNALRF